MSDSSDMECEVSCSQENWNTISADNNKVPSKKQNDIVKVCDFNDTEYEVSQVFYSQKNRDTILADDNHKVSGKKQNNSSAGSSFDRRYKKM